MVAPTCPKGLIVEPPRWVLFKIPMPSDKLGIGLACAG